MNFTEVILINRKIKGGKVTWNSGKEKSLKCFSQILVKSLAISVSDLNLFHLPEKQLRSNFLTSMSYIIIPVYNKRPGALCSLKNFKCMFAAANHQATDLLKTGTSGKEWRDDRLKTVNLKPWPMNVTEVKKKGSDFWIPPKGPRKTERISQQ